MCYLWRTHRVEHMHPHDDHKGRRIHMARSRSAWGEHKQLPIRKITMIDGYLGTLETQAHFSLVSLYSRNFLCSASSSGSISSCGLSNVLSFVVALK